LRILLQKTSLREFQKIPRKPDLTAITSVKRENMSMKLYVGNLPESMTDDKLKTIFAEAGPVASAKVITDRYTGQPRGFGFVEMETKVDGQRAISMFNGKEVDGNTLKVNEARPQAKGGGRFGGGGGGGRFGGGGGRGGGGGGGRRY
jgi:cold-inducible RNA-binding protein